MGTWFITYSRDMAPPTEVWLLVTERDGCVLGITGPALGVNLPQRPEIGTYGWACPPSDSEAVRQLLPAAIAAVPDSDPVPPGMPFLTFGLGRKDAEELESHASLPLNAVLPPAVAKFDEAILRIARKALEKPQRVLRVTSSPEASLYGAHGELQARLRLANAGTELLQIRNPAGADEPGVSLLLEDARGEITFIEAKKGEVAELGEDGKPRLATAETKLKPNESIIIEINVRRHVYLRSGSYGVQVRFRSETDGIPAAEAVPGLLQTAAGQMHVNAKARK